MKKMLILTAMVLLTGAAALAKPAQSNISEMNRKEILLEIEAQLSEINQICERHEGKVFRRIGHKNRYIKALIKEWKTRESQKTVYRPVLDKESYKTTLKNMERWDWKSQYHGIQSIVKKYGLTTKQVKGILKSVYGHEKLLALFEVCYPHISDGQNAYLLYVMAKHDFEKKRILHSAISVKNPQARILLEKEHDRFNSAMVNTHGDVNKLELLRFASLSQQLDSEQAVILINRFQRDIYKLKAYEIIAPVITDHDQMDVRALEFYDVKQQRKLYKRWLALNKA